MFKEREIEILSYLAFYLQLNQLGEGHHTIRKCSLTTPPNQHVNLSRNTFRDPPRMMVSQMPGYSVAQASLSAHLSLTAAMAVLPEVLL